LDAPQEAVGRVSLGEFGWAGLGATPRHMRRANNVERDHQQPDRLKAVVGPF